MVNCEVRNTQFDLGSRTFRFELICENNRIIKVSLSYNEAEKLYGALGDMEMRIYAYKTGGYVDDY